MGGRHRLQPWDRFGVNAGVKNLLCLTTGYAYDRCRLHGTSHQTEDSAPGHPLCMHATETQYACCLQRLARGAGGEGRAGGARRAAVGGGGWRRRASGVGCGVLPTPRVSLCLAGVNGSAIF